MTSHKSSCPAYHHHHHHHHHPLFGVQNPKPLGYAVTVSAATFFQMGIESDRESRRSVDGLISRELEPLGGKNNWKRSFEDKTQCQ
jgi:hypothetical protein